MRSTCSLLFTGKKLFVYGFILVMSHCKDTYDNTKAYADLKVPPFTETGAGTFGCLVSGTPWANFGENWTQEELGGYLTPNKVTGARYVDSGVNVISISAGLTESRDGMVIKRESMTISFPDTSRYTGTTGTYQLTWADGLFWYSIADGTYPNYSSDGIYSSLKRSPFTVSVLKDTLYGSPYPTTIISGKFSGMLYNRAQTDSIRITGGVFDAKF